MVLVTVASTTSIVLISVTTNTPLLGLGNTYISRMFTKLFIVVHALTDNVITVFPIQVPFDPVIEYVDVVVGLAITVLPVLLLSEFAGLHV